MYTFPSLQLLSIRFLSSTMSLLISSYTQLSRDVADEIHGFVSGDDDIWNEKRKLYPLNIFSR